MDSTAATITVEELAAIQGTPGAPRILDVRPREVFRAASGWIAGARHCPPDAAPAYGNPCLANGLVIYCADGDQSRHMATTLFASIRNVSVLEGGIAAVGISPKATRSGVPAPALATVRKRSDLGVDGERVSSWITREHPKIDRVACPWLIRRFIDPRAEFHYVPASEVFRAAVDLGAVPYDLPGAPVTHEWERCSFDSLLGAFDLHSPALDRMAIVVRAADTNRPRLAPEATGLLALSQGLSRLHKQDDHAMLAAAMPMYDALYAWACERDAKPHTWREHDVSSVPAAGAT